MNTLSLEPHWFFFSNKSYGAIQALRIAVGRRRVCVLHFMEIVNYGRINALIQSRQLVRFSRKAYGFLLKWLAYGRST